MSLKSNTRLLGQFGSLHQIQERIRESTAMGTKSELAEILHEGAHGMLSQASQGMAHLDLADSLLSGVTPFTRVMTGVKLGHRNLAV